jgi:plasmid maintenance system killer protein
MVYRLVWFSIRLNERWRLVLRWSDGHAFDVAIVDHH